MNARPPLATPEQPSLPGPVEDSKQRPRWVEVLGLEGDTTLPETRWLPPMLMELLAHELRVGGQLLIVPGERAPETRTADGAPGPAPLTFQQLHRLRPKPEADLLLSGSCRLSDDVEGGGLQLVVYVHDARTGALRGHVQAFGPYAPGSLVASVGAALRRRLGIHGRPTREAARRDAGGSRRRTAPDANARGTRSFRRSLRKASSS